MTDEDKIREIVREEIENLEEGGQKNKYSRRRVMQALGTVGIGAGLGAAGQAAVGSSEASSGGALHGIDQIGLSDDPVGTIYVDELYQNEDAIDTDSINPLSGSSISIGGTFDHQENDITNVGAFDAGELNNAVAVKSESDLSNLSSGQYGYIPSETTVNITSQFRPPGGLTLDIFGTLRQADGADLDSTMINFTSVSDVTIRLFGTIDGNQANQSATDTRLVNQYNDGTTEPRRNKLFGPGTVTNMQDTAVVQDNGGRDLYIGGFTVKNWVPNNTGNSFISWAAGNDLSEGFTIEGITFAGDTFGGTEGDGDIISGQNSDQRGLTVSDCKLFDIPRRGIQGGDRAIGNKAINPAQPGGGGDFITSVKVIVGNVLLGTFDGNGDNGIIARTPSTIVNNYVEGFTNHGIKVANPGGDSQLMTIRGNVLVDNNQAQTSGNANLRVAATNATGGFLVKGNVCWGDAIDPLNNIVINGNAENGRVTENITTGATTEISDSSVSSVTVSNNITI